jgi:hypothetical protein
MTNTPQQFAIASRVLSLQTLAFGPRMRRNAQA